MSAEAWKDTGKCSECRRKPYCKTKCTANKRAVRELIEEHFIRSETTGRLYLRPSHLIGGNEDG